MAMSGFWRTAVLGFVVFAVIFDSLIIGAVLHGSDTSNSTITGPVQTYPDTNSDNPDYIDPLPASSLVEIPLIQPN